MIDVTADVSGVILFAVRNFKTKEGRDPPDPLPDGRRYRRPHPIKRKFYFVTASMAAKNASMVSSPICPRTVSYTLEAFSFI